MNFFPLCTPGLSDELRPDVERRDQVRITFFSFLSIALHFHIR